MKKQNNKEKFIIGGGSISLKKPFNPVEKFIKPFAKTVLIPLKPIVDPLERLADFMFRLFSIIGIFKIFIEYVKSFLYYITDPMKMLSDIRHGFFTGITLIYETLVDFIFGNLQSKLNYRNINTLNNKKDNFVKNTDCNDPNSHCYSPSFITIVLLILCPPFAMLLLLGMSGILHIIICCILTYFLI